MREKEFIYACKNKDDTVRYNSTSGGLFSSLCKYVIGQGGYVAGVRFDDEFVTEHAIAATMEECQQFVGSKYPQSNVGNIYKEVQKLLTRGKLVLFTGTPCQAAALKSVLGKEYENLITVDLICMGVASPGVWKTYLNYAFPNQKIRSIKLKDKKFGWHRFSVKIDAENGQLHEVGSKNIFMRTYIDGKMMRKSCYRCPFKGNYRFSDITIADCWGIEKIDLAFDDNRGVSIAFIHTNLGQQVFEWIANDMESFQISMQQATDNNIYYHISRPLTAERAQFFQEYLQNPGKCFKKNNPRSLLFKIKRKLYC